MVLGWDSYKLQNTAHVPMCVQWSTQIAEMTYLAGKSCGSNVTFQIAMLQCHVLRSTTDCQHSSALVGH